jgi:hypothetical protein
VTVGAGSGTGADAMHPPPFVVMATEPLCLAIDHQIDPLCPTPEHRDLHLNNRPQGHPHL